MQNNNIPKNHTFIVGGTELPCKQIPIQGAYQMPVPESFILEDAVSSRYTCLSDRQNTPLGFAIRFAPLQEPAAKEKMVRSYFGGEPYETLAGDFIYYREARHGGSAFSVYLMRFAVETVEGLLLGCFNCNAEDGDNWKPAVLSMLQGISPASDGENA